MVAANPNDRIPPAVLNPVPPVNRLAKRVRHYSELARETFLLDAGRGKIDFRQQRETRDGTEPARRQSEGANKWFTARPQLSAEDIRLHAWLSERLAALHRERYGLWPRFRRFLFDNRLGRWLGLHPQRTADGRKYWWTR
jgi:hypothetical protein